MFRLGLLASLIIAPACRYSLEDDNVVVDGSGIDAPISVACQEATTYQNLANIEEKIFKQSCIFAGCHNGANTAAGMLDLRMAMARADLVMVDSRLPGQTGRKFVVPSDPTKSWLLVMIGQIPPAMADPPSSGPGSDPGFMPQNAGGQLICVQKREAIVRWIMAGALDN